MVKDNIMPVAQPWYWFHYYKNSSNKYVLWWKNIVFCLLLPEIYCSKHNYFFGWCKLTDNWLGWRWCKPLEWRWCKPLEGVVQTIGVWVVQTIGMGAVQTIGVGVVQTIGMGVVQTIGVGVVHIKFGTSWLFFKVKYNLRSAYFQIVFLGF